VTARLTGPGWADVLILVVDDRRRYRPLCVADLDERRLDVVDVLGKARRRLVDPARVAKLALGHGRQHFEPRRGRGKQRFEEGPQGRGCGARTRQSQVSWSFELMAH
jgi:hypothetical protein